MNRTYPSTPILLCYGSMFCVAEEQKQECLSVCFCENSVHVHDLFVHPPVSIPRSRDTDICLHMYVHVAGCLREERRSRESFKRTYRFPEEDVIQGCL